MGITIYDVATGARVSPATVSRVLAGGGSVAPDTAKRVREVIERLGYRPDRVAQSLRRQRSRAIGLVIPMIRHPASREIVARLSDQLAENDLSLVIASSDGERVGDAVNRLVSQRVDGLIVVRVRPSVDIPASDDVEMPVIALDSGIVHADVDTVRVDHEAGIRQAVRFLVREGAKRLVYLGEGNSSVVGAQQLDGYAAATAEFDDLAAAIRLGPPTQGFAQGELLRLLATSDPPDAYLCGSDVVAATINAALPLEPAEERPFIVGWGAMPWAELLRPRLTTVRLPTEELIDEAIRLLDQRLSGLRGEPVDIALPPSLVLGDTT